MARKIKPCGKVLALALKDQQRNLFAMRLIQCPKQGFDQLGRQGIAFLRPVQRQYPAIGIPADLQYCIATHQALRASAMAASTSSLCSPNAGGRRAISAVRPLKRMGETNVLVRTPLGSATSCTQSICCT